MEGSKEYSMGLKNGYFLRKNHPALIKSLLSGARGDSDYVEGLKAGSEEFEKERTRNQKGMNSRKWRRKETDRDMRVS